MKLELKKQTLEYKQEIKQSESKSGSVVAELHEQISDTLQELEKAKLESKTLQDELQKSKLRVSTADISQSKASDKVASGMPDLNKMVEAARHMKLAELQYVHYQIFSMLNSSYKMPTMQQPAMYPPGPQMPPYYPYHMH